MNFSVVIAARNEEANIEQVVKQVLQQSYPPDQIELIVVNDHSTDRTSRILANIHDPRIKKIDLKDSFGKKAALSAGIAEAKFNHIAVTDADCALPSNWLSNLAKSFDNTAAIFITGPVIISAWTNLLYAFQSLDTVGTCAVTQSGINSNRWYMANGANMAFSKSVFNEVSGFEASNKWASGDDMFLIDKFSEKGIIAYLKTKDAVITGAERSWKGLFNQRIRWATKNRSYNHKGVRNTLSLVFIFNALVFVILFSSIFLGIKYFLLGLGLLILKWVTDAYFLSKLTRYFGTKSSMIYFPLASITYVLYLVVIGVFSLFKKNYVWKDRRVQ